MFAFCKLDNIYGWHHYINVCYLQTIKNLPHSRDHRRPIWPSNRDFGHSPSFLTFRFLAISGGHDRRSCGRNLAGSSGRNFGTYYLLYDDLSRPSGQDFQSWPAVIGNHFAGHDLQALEGHFRRSFEPGGFPAGLPAEFPRSSERTNQEAYFSGSDLIGIVKKNS